MTSGRPERGDGAFLAELGHELRTPLGAMVGFAEAMRDEAFGPLGGIYREHAALIVAAGRRLEALAADLLALQPRPAERCDPADLAAEAVALLSMRAGAAGVSLAVSPPAAPILARAVPSQVLRILLNLIANALAATPAGGSVTVAVSADSDAVRLSVADTGKGPPADGGEGSPGPSAGLGLAIVRRLCAAHGGTLVLSAAAGGGTVAVATLARGADAGP